MKTTHRQIIVSPVNQARLLLCGCALLASHCFAASPGPASPRQISGIYPHLATFNNEGECGTGAVVPWADRLWVISYGPHLPFGSSDKLYEITPDLRQIIRPESVGGTPANRMIHRESQQLIIGPYFINTQRQVRVIPPKAMPGRHTGNARHLTDPANQVYFGTMEEGLYEVDVHSLAVRGLIKDGNPPKPGQTEEKQPATLDSQLPGYHGKGLYSGQGRLVYANNGERGKDALTNPNIPSGALGEWRGSGDWQLVRRNQFTEVSGPGGLYGNSQPDQDPIWSIGWDARSLILMLLDKGKWSSYRLPKASHAYDGAHGWNTEWPRIRDIGEDFLLMTMHGSFWRFPRTFSLANSAGLAPRSTYLKVIGDFCRWQDRLVFGCDDSAKSEFLNQRKAKGKLAPPGKSNSNLWFTEPARPDQLGPALGRGAVWLNDEVQADVPSDPFLFSGFAYRSLHLTHQETVPVVFTLEVDQKGDNEWTTLRTLEVPAQGYVWTAFTARETGAWVRIKASRKAAKATAFFHYRNLDDRGTNAPSLFAGVARPGDAAVSGGLLLVRGAEFRTLRFVAQQGSRDLGAYDLNGELLLQATNDPTGAAWTRQNAAIPTNVLTVDAASVIYEDAQGRWRLPKGSAAYDQPSPLGDERICREVCTERDLFNAYGTFYELPAENAGGFAKIRPLTTHDRRIKDYASYRGMLFLSGISADAPADNPHIIRSADGRCALWAGVVDDLWQLGKPRGRGGPWHNTKVQAGVPSDPYLMTGYDHKHLTLSHQSSSPVKMRVEVDLAGLGQWVVYQEFTVPPGQPVQHQFADAFSAYWVRCVASQETTATATLVYE
jgi:hypothetical protein